MVSENAPGSVGFEVIRNERRVCVAGLRGHRGVVSLILHWHGSEEHEEIVLDVGGLDADTREGLTWAQRPLAIGDELVIRVIDNAVSTRVRSRKSWDDAFAAKHEKAWLRRTAKKYGFKLVRSAGRRAAT